MYGAKTNILSEMTVEEKLARVEAYIHQLRGERQPLQESRIKELQDMVRDDVDVIYLIESIPILHEVWQQDARKLTPTEREQTILRLMQYDARIRRIDIGRMMNVCYATIKNHLKSLESKGVVRFDGKCVRTGHWVVRSRV